MASVWQLPAAHRTAGPTRQASLRLQPRTLQIGAQTQRCLRCRAQQSCDEAPSRTNAKLHLPANLQPALAAVAANLLSALPAHADAGKIFDFNLTLPIMVTQFLLLMVFLEKFWFTPVGKNLDERDKYIRDKLANVKGNSSELEALQKEAEAATAKARGEAGELIAKARGEAQAQSEKELKEVKARLDKELEQALAALDKERDTAVSNLDQQVDKLAADILGRVLPDGVKL